MHSKIFLVAVSILIVVILSLRKRQKRLTLNAKKGQLKTFYGGQSFFLCDCAEDIGENLIQLYGEVSGGTVTPGMKIVGLNGKEFIIKEVYANDSTPTIANKEVSEGEGSAIVIEMSGWDWPGFRETVKRDKIVPLKLV